MIFNTMHSGKEINIFSQITALSQENAAVNLSQSSPDYELDPRLKSFLKESIEIDMNPYASCFSLPLLNQNLIKFNSKRKLPLTLQESETTIVPGATYGMYVAFATFLEPNDEVIIIEPSYDTYLPAVEIRKAKPVFVCLNENFEMDWNLLKDSITPKTRAIVINTPHNPTGKVWDKKDWDILWDIIKEENIVVIADEVYDCIIFDGREYYSAFHHPEIKNRCFCIHSFEKTFHIAGWKASYIVASQEFTNRLRKIHQYLCFTANYHSQYAIAKYLEVFDIEENKIFFQKKRDLLLHLLKDLPFTITDKTSGSYCQTFDFTAISNRISDKDFAIWLIKNCKVAIIPYSAFYHQEKNTGKLRMCFAKKDETLIQAAENLKKYL